eukprot:scaffold988_cov165-Ochromonas_danica.AAC.1
MAWMKWTKFDWMGLRLVLLMGDLTICLTRPVGLDKSVPIGQPKPISTTNMHYDTEDYTHTSKMIIYFKRMRQNPADDDKECNAKEVVHSTTRNHSLCPLCWQLIDCVFQRT